MEYAVKLVTTDKPRGLVLVDSGIGCDAVVMGEVTCDGTYMFLGGLRRSVLQVAEDYLKEHPNATMLDVIEDERFHTADMKYGKNAQVVTWTVIAPIQNSTVN